MNNLVKLLQCVEEVIPPPEGEHHILHLHEDGLMIGIKVDGQWCKIELRDEDIRHYKTFAINTKKKIEKLKNA